MVLQNVRRWATGAALCAALGLPMGAWAQELVDVVKAAAAAKDPSEKAFYQDLADMHRKLAGASGLSLRLFVSRKTSMPTPPSKKANAGWC